MRLRPHAGSAEASAALRRPPCRRRRSQRPRAARRPGPRPGAHDGKARRARRRLAMLIAPSVSARWFLLPGFFCIGWTYYLQQPPAPGRSNRLVVGNERSPGPWRIARQGTVPMQEASEPAQPGSSSRAVSLSMSLRTLRDHCRWRRYACRYRPPASAVNRHCPRARCQPVLAAAAGRLPPGATPVLPQSRRQVPMPARVVRQPPIPRVRQLSTMRACSVCPRAAEPWRDGRLALPAGPQC